MKKIIIFTSLIIFYNLTISNLLAQNTNNPNKTQNNQPKRQLTAKEQQNIELAKQYQNETNDLNNAIKKLNPADRTKFNNINIKSEEKIRNASNNLKKELEKYGKPNEILIISSHIFNKKNDDRMNNAPNEIKQKINNSIASFNKFDNEKKKAIKKLIIKFRREVSNIQNQKQQEIKKIFGKEYKLINAFEKEEDIAIDEKTIQ
jgi:hypothetical protein